MLKHPVERLCWHGPWYVPLKQQQFHAWCCTAAVLLLLNAARHRCAGMQLAAHSLHSRPPNPCKLASRTGALPKVVAHGQPAVPHCNNPLLSSITLCGRSSGSCCLPGCHPTATAPRLLPAACCFSPRGPMPMGPPGGPMNGGPPGPPEPMRCMSRAAMFARRCIMSGCLGSSGGPPDGSLGPSVNCM